MTEFPVLPFNVEEYIVQHIASLFLEHNIDISFNIPLRDRVFDILDKFCTVVYYPLQNDENNGFHIKDMPFANGSTQDFVFINTSQTIDKQVFTAAHELGHIWGIDECVLQKISIDEIDDVQEKVINRFAATLLMPNEQFKNVLIKEYKKLCNDEGKISVVNLIKMIVLLMNHFLSPKKAVILRMVELGFLDEDDAKLIIYNENVECLIQKFIYELGFHNLQFRTEKKWIEGLSGLLDKAETHSLFPKQKIAFLRNKFDLREQIPITEELKDTLSLSSLERYDT